MKKAVLVVSFGTSYHETRRKTIDACENKIREALREYDFYRAYTSRIIIKKLNSVDGIFINNEDEALEKLYRLGYEEVIVQSLHIICGNEYNKLKYKVEIYEEKFEKITLGRPLLTYINDYKEVIEAIKYQIPVIKEDEVLLFMGHGTPHESHKSYSTLERMMRSEGINAYISTIEGCINLEDTIKKLKKNNIKKVYLMPLMLVAGKHALKDMASEKKSWKTILEKENFNVEIYIKGLGENPYIQYKFMKHAYDCIEKAESL